LKIYGNSRNTLPAGTLAGAADDFSGASNGVLNNN